MTDKFRLTENFLNSYKHKKPPFGFNGLGELVYLRTYSRLKENGDNERFWETVQRVTEGCFNMQKRWIEQHRLGWNAMKAQKSAQEMYDRIFNMKFLPPGRGLWACGTDIVEKRGLAMALNNCAFVSTATLYEDRSKPFCFLADVSMLGVGCGFDTKGAGKLNIVEPQKTTYTFIIEDTREAWVESLKLLLDSYFDGTKTVQFDYSKIRGPGLPIKGFGGVSSGPDPLKDLHEDVRKVLNSNVGKPISITTIVDIMNLIGKCVVAGNVRRTAEIVFGDADNEEYLDLKNYKINPHRESYGWTSNNSIFCELGMDYSKAAERTKINGEPGYAWLENMQSYSRMNNGKDNKDHRVLGGNPSLRFGTKVFTTDGIFEIQDLQDKEFKVRNLNNQISNAKCFLSGKNKELIKITLLGGKEYYATPEHEWPIYNKGEFKKVKTKDLKPNTYLPVIKNNKLTDGTLGSYDEGFLMGWLYGDGWLTVRSDNKKTQLGWIVSAKDGIVIANRLTDILKAISPTFTGTFHKNKGCFELNTTNKEIIDHLSKLGVQHKSTGLPSLLWNEWSEACRKGFVDALFSTDGMVETTGRISLFSSHNQLINDVSELLGFYGIKNTIISRTRKGNFPNGKDYKRDYISYTLRISEQVSRVHFSELFKLSLAYKQERLDVSVVDTKVPSKYESLIKIKAVEKTELREDVWDITVYDDTHCFQLSHCITGNCLEQSLESYEVCNLVETFPNNHENVEDYITTLKYAYLYAKTVTLGETHWPETNRVMLRNRRIGCSMSGIAQFITSRGLHELKNWCEQGYEAIERYDEIYSDWLAIPKSIKKTSIKPSGTVSLLAGATPGIHYPENNYYIRRMRLGKTSDMIQPLKDAGYKLEPCYGSEDSTVVVEIPVKVADNIRTIRDVGIWEQTSLAAFMQKYWADNQVSCTVTFKKDEGDQIKHVLDIYQYQLKGISFLPMLENGGAYRQMPYEAITENKYTELISKLKPLKLRGIKNEEAEVERFCSNDSCQLVTKAK